MQHTPYPFARLPKLTRATVRTVAELSAWSSGLAIREACEAAGLLLGATFAASAGPPQIHRPDQPHAETRWPAVWAELRRADATGRLCMELPLGLAELLVDRTLGGDGARGSAASGAAFDDLSLGALAYLIARACATLGGELVLCGLVQRTSAESTPPHTWLTWPLSLRIGADSALAWLHVEPSDHTGCAGAALLPRARGPRRALAELPVTLWADAGYVRLPQSSLRGLCRGDVLVLEHTGLVHEHSRFTGTVMLRAVGSGSGLRCRADAQRLEVRSIACTPEPSMSIGRHLPRIAPEPEAVGSDRENGEHEAGALGDPAVLVADAPIELQLELARFQLTLGELPARAGRRCTLHRSAHRRGGDAEGGRPRARARRAGRRRGRDRCALDRDPARVSVPRYGVIA